MPRASTKKKAEDEYFDLVEYTADLDPITLERRIEAESSLYRWAEVVIGYENLPPEADYRLYEPIHRPMCDRVEMALPIRGRENRGVQAKVLDLEPRGSLKTNLETATAGLFYFTQNYSGSELISSHSHDASKEILTIMKWHLEFNETFKLFYGDWAYYAKRYGTWTQEEVRLAFRGAGVRSPSIDTTGAEMSKTGGHYDVIFVDDIQNRENSASEKQRANVRARFQEYIPQLNPSGAMIVPATRYHRADVYAWIMKRKAEALKRIASRTLTAAEKAEQESWLFDITIRSAWNDDGSLYYPTRLTRQFLQQQEDELEPYLFSVWYRNESIDDTSKVFVDPHSKERDFDFVRGLIPYIQIPSGAARAVYTTLSWDPKGRDNPNKPNDAHGIIINGTDVHDVWWILRSMELRGALDYVLDTIAMLLREHCCMGMSIETRGSSTQGLYIDLLRPVLAQYNLADIPILEWSPGTTESKDTLIRSLQPRYRQGKMWFRKHHCDELVGQMDDYPQVEHDDVLDALVQQKKLARPPDLSDAAVGMEDEGTFDDDGESAEPTMRSGGWVGLGTPTYAA